jgi:hypothetical protein
MGMALGNLLTVKPKPQSLHEGTERSEMSPLMPEAIRTQSPIKAWYLATFRGKKVFTTICQPTLCVFGVILYQYSWVLVSSDHSASVVGAF